MLVIAFSYQKSASNFPRVYGETVYWFHDSGTTDNFGPYLQHLNRHEQIDTEGLASLAHVLQTLQRKLKVPHIIWR